MTQEEIERNFEFIVRQQAQFAADIQLLQERQAKGDEKLDKLADMVLATVGAVDRLTVAQERTERRLADFQIQTERKFAATDERLNVLINVVERYFSRERGDSKPRLPDA